MRWILLCLMLSGCAIDQAIEQADRVCNAETQLKDDYRTCLYNEYRKLRGIVWDS